MIGTYYITKFLHTFFCSVFTTLRKDICCFEFFFNFKQQNYTHLDLIMNRRYNLTNYVYDSLTCM